MQLRWTLALLVGAAAAQDSPAPPAATTPTPTTVAPTPTTPAPTTPAATTATTAPTAPTTSTSSGAGSAIQPFAAFINATDFTNVNLANSVDSVRIDISGGKLVATSDAANEVQTSFLKRIRVLMGNTTNKLMLNTLESDAIDRLEVAAYEVQRQARVNFSNAGLGGLTSLSSLTFSNILFFKSSVNLTSPNSLSYLKVENTNAVDLGVSPNTDLKQVDFTNNLFGTFPFVLYQRKYTELNILSPLNISSSVTNLSSEEFSNAKHNLENATKLVSFQSSCENVESSELHIVCSDSTRDGIRSFGGTNFKDNAATPTPSTTSRNSSSNTTLTVIVIVIAVIAAVLAYFVARRYFCTSASSSRSPRINERTVGLISKEDPQSQNKLSFISSDDALRPIRLEQQDITMNKSLGTGRLWVGDYSGRKVIIKRIEAESSDSYATKGLITQARALATVLHPNIVSLIGVTWIQGTDFGVVAEFMEKGTLRSVLSDLDSELDLQSKLHMCLDIAQGLMYLHSSDRNMYMKRLTSRKVLVNGAIECKLNLYECHPCTNRIEYPEVFGAGELAWEAPELITRTGVLDPRKINIFSLGVLIGEIMTRVSPYQSAVDAVGHTLADLELSKRIRRQERLMPHENRREFTELPAVLRDMVERCLSYQPLMRPTAEEVVHCLESVKDYSERVGSTTSL